MPQPISTPTAAGMIARRVGITEPTVAPMPACTSGMAAAWPNDRQLLLASVPRVGIEIVGEDLHRDAAAFDDLPDGMMAFYRRATGRIGAR